MRRWRFVFLIGSAFAVQAAQIGFDVNNISSDQPGVAPVTDGNLVNAWGLASSPTSPLWVNANGSGNSLVYNGATGAKLGLTVTIPGDGSATGVTFNGTTGFHGDNFLFVSEDGTFSGWRNALGTSAETLGSNPDAVYKGLTEAVVGGNTYAYAANFGQGAIHVFKGGAGAPDLTGSFTDPGLPSGYAPFDIMNIGGVLYVTYAVQDSAKKDDVPGLGNGVVDKFDLNGNFLGRVTSGGALNSPWGIAMAPSGFGGLGGDLLIGNFGDGMIHAYNPTTGAMVETVSDGHGNPITIDGLWGLRFGNGAAGGPANTLFFSAGPDGEAHGLLGSLTTVPEPGTCALAALGIAFLFLRRRTPA